MLSLSTWPLLRRTSTFAPCPLGILATNDSPTLTITLLASANTSDAFQRSS